MNQPLHFANLSHPFFSQTEWHEQAWGVVFFYFSVPFARRWVPVQPTLLVFEPD